MCGMDASVICSVDVAFSHCYVRLHAFLQEREERAAQRAIKKSYVRVSH